MCFKKFTNEIVSCIMKLNKKENSKVKLRGEQIMMEKDCTKKEYSALDIARYIINKSHEIGHPVSNLKLQKLLYFCQGFSLSILKEECFNDEIEAWDFGPVVPSVYHEFKENGSNNIQTIEKYFKFDLGNLSKSGIHEFKEDDIGSNIRELVDFVLKVFKETSATTMVKLTHMQSPWKDNYKPNMSKIIIPKEQLRDYFYEKYAKGKGE